MHPLPDSDKSFEQFEKILSGNPYLTGVFMHGGWSEIEAKEGEYNWESMDRAIEVLRKTGKKYALDIGGSRPPNFVYAAGAEKFVYRDDNPHHGARYLTEMSMPLPWDPIWQKYYENILRKAGERYSSDPNCLSIVLTCSRTAEMHFPRRPEEAQRWRAYENWDKRVIDSYTTLMDVLAEAFPRQQIVLMVSQMFNENDATGHSDEQIVVPIIEYGLKRYPDRLTLQTNQLDGRRDATGKFAYDILMKYQDRLHNGFQSLASFATPDRQGSIEMSVFNFLQAGAEYWELWRGDGANVELCQQLTEALNEALKVGAKGYKQSLIDNGQFRKPEEDTYPQKVQAMRDAAIKEWEKGKKSTTAPAAIRP